MKKISVAIIGAGLIGKKRADALSKITDYQLASIYDVNKEAKENFASTYHCEPVKNVNNILVDKRIDLIILAIVHKHAAQLAPKILQHKHLLIEKPLGRNLKEARDVVNSAKKNKNHLFVGFNYHYYPHIQLAKKYLEKEKLGKIISSTFKIGHAAFPGYQKTWKMDKDLCGGGVILDPGIHMIDLMLALLGKPNKFNSSYSSLGWKSRVEDEAFITFKFKDGSISSHHYSLNLPQNTLFIELVGTKGIVRLTGRGGNYGDMKFNYIPKWFWQTHAKVISKNFGHIDNTFIDELKDISQKINKKSIEKQYETYILPASIAEKLLLK